MITVVPQQGLGELLGAGLGQGFAQGIQRNQSLAEKLSLMEQEQKGTLAEKLQAHYMKQASEEAQTDKKISGFKQLGYSDETSTALANMDPGIAKEYVQGSMEARIYGLPDPLEDLVSRFQGEAVETTGQAPTEQTDRRVPSEEEIKIREMAVEEGAPQQRKGPIPISQRSDEELRQLSLSPRFGKGAQSELDRRQKQKELEQKQFDSDRKFHTEQSKDDVKEYKTMRQNLPKQQRALDAAINAVKSGETGFFSLDNLANMTGLDAFRTAKGAELITAAKEFLLSNMSRISARGQNLWFEQRLASMFPKIGQSDEANFAVAEMLDAENMLDQVYINAFQKLLKEDEEKFGVGFVSSNIKDRALDVVENVQEDIFKRAAYRSRMIEEQEKGVKDLKKQLGKKVVPGTPMTLLNATLYMEKFGDKWEDIAKKKGYEIPTLEEYNQFIIESAEYRKRFK